MLIKNLECCLSTGTSKKTIWLIAFFMSLYIHFHMHFYIIQPNQCGSHVWFCGAWPIHWYHACDNNNKIKKKDFVYKFNLNGICEHGTPMCIFKIGLMI